MLVRLHPGLYFRDVHTNVLSPFFQAIFSFSYIFHEVLSDIAEEQKDTDLFSSLIYCRIRSISSVILDVLGDIASCCMPLCA